MSGRSADIILSSCMLLLFGEIQGFKLGVPDGFSGMKLVDGMGKLGGTLLGLPG